MCVRVCVCVCACFSQAPCYTLEYSRLFRHFLLLLFSQHRWVYIEIRAVLHHLNALATRKVIMAGINGGIMTNFVVLF